MKYNLSLKEQVKILGDFLMKEYPSEIKNGGAIETAIQILKKQKEVWDSGFLKGFKDCQDMVKRGEHKDCCLKLDELKKSL